MDGHHRQRRGDALRLVPRGHVPHFGRAWRNICLYRHRPDRSTNYAYTVTAFDAAGNSAASDALNVTTNAPPDTTAPIKPATPTLVSKTDTTVSISWTATTDNVAVTVTTSTADATFLTSSPRWNDSPIPTPAHAIDRSPTPSRRRCRGNSTRAIALSVTTNRHRDRAGHSPARTSATAGSSTTRTTGE